MNTLTICPTCRVRLAVDPADPPPYPKLVLCLRETLLLPLEKTLERVFWGA